MNFMKVSSIMEHLTYCRYALTLSLPPAISIVYSTHTIVIKLKEKYDAVVVDCNHNNSVILLPAHPSSFAHNFVSGMQSFYFSESQDAIVLQTCH